MCESQRWGTLQEVTVQCGMTLRMNFVTIWSPCIVVSDLENSIYTARHSNTVFASGITNST